MLVQDVMQTKLFTVTPETTLPEALRLTGAARDSATCRSSMGTGWWASCRIAT